MHNLYRQLWHPTGADSPPPAVGNAAAAPPAIRYRSWSGRGNNKLLLPRVAGTAKTADDRLFPVSPRLKPGNEIPAKQV
jgi:hypothetical protein